MKRTKLLMGMPITVNIVDAFANEEAISRVFSYFEYIDGKFSTYKYNSETTLINLGQVKENDYSEDMKTVLALAEETKAMTNGYFNVRAKGRIDPLGLVKGWAIHNAAKLLQERGFANFYIDAGGDIQAQGKNSQGQKWRVGIRDPFHRGRIIKVVCLADKGAATSGTYIRGQHIYNPLEKNKPITEIVSLSVIGPNIYEADRFATAAFAMGKQGIAFVERLAGFEGYSIDSAGLAATTSGFKHYVSEL